ncbi:MAG: DOMON-like domain-containing protein [Gammaproteobacteria bacterium]|nr:DOMON-like domain-containing protein [Gammaproteobacteria bacterium]MCP5136847.1 DOMON-like domain-containing protein [Gammaproteobacteria bacterium]
MHTLVPFPGLAGGPPPRIDLQMATGFIADGALRISVVLRVGEMILRIPDAGVPGVVDGLWRHTCFEVFVQGEDAPAYAEFNLSPSRQWAAYRFSGYRDQGCALVMPDPGIECVRDAERLTLAATLSASALPPGSPLHIGLTAVLEDTAGKLSYWALGHTGERPDFHRADSFTLNLER